MSATGAGVIQSCSDTSHTIAVVVGDRLEYRIVETNPTAASLVELGTILVCQ
jgi:hypothetical protein